MKALPSKRTSVTLVLLTTVVLAICIWATWLWINLPRDILRKNLTIEEAQNLVSFPICTPAYKPPEINPDPQIIYDADAANVPHETYIRLRYQRANNHKTVFEIFQRYTQDSGMKTEYPETAHDSAKVTLLDWISYPKFLSKSEMEAAMTRAHLVSSVFETNGTIWWLYEITDPIEYRSTMTRWIKDHVEYRVLSLLPTEEIKKVTLSILDCSNP